MSSSFHQLTKKFDPLGHASVEKVFGIEKQEKKQTAAESLTQRMSDERDASNAAIAEKMKVRQVETRRDALGRSASAAGATRIEDDRDLVRNDLAPKRRQAARLLLGE